MPNGTVYNAIFLNFLPQLIFLYLSANSYGNIYTTIAALCAKLCHQNRTDFYLPALNSTSIIAYIFLRLHIASPRPLDRSLFAFVLCFLRHKIKKYFASPQLRFLDEIFMRQFSRRCRHSRLIKNAHDIERLRTTKHNGRFYSFINKSSFRGSSRFIFTGSCSAIHGLLLS